MQKYYEKGEKFAIKKYKNYLGGFLIATGILIGIYFLLPVFFYQMFLGNYSDGNIEAPIPKYMVVDDNNIGNLLASGIQSLTLDYTDARNWYPQIAVKAQTAKQKTKVDEYQLSIPKIKIVNANVSTTDYDLDQHLIQYLGTSIPGQNGTAVIFGHSTLPSLFNPSNYKTIFAYAHTLKVGDEMTATVNGSSYRYKIFSVVITSPEDTNILSQSYDHSYITLVTCTPPGTTWKRLIIRAALEGDVNST